MLLWTPAEYSPAAWFAAGEGAAVGQWDDKSGNNRHFTQATPSYQPAITAADLNGYDVLTFDGASDHFVLPSGFLYNATDLSFFIVFKTPQQTNDGVFGPITSYSQGFALINYGTSTWVRLNNVDKITSGVWNLNSTYCSTAVVANADSVSAWKNGALVGAPAAGSATLNFNGQYCLGRYFALENCSAQSVAEIVICTSTLSADDVARTVGYLHWKFGMESLLPTDHPYKSAAPTINKVSGVVTVNGSPAARTVAVFLRSDFTLIGTTTSDETTGAFELNSLLLPDTANALLVTAIDSSGTYNAVSVDYITSVAQ